MSQQQDELGLCKCECSCRVFASLIDPHNGLCSRCDPSKSVYDPLHLAWHRQEMYNDKTHGWVQWKGTQVCMDFYCIKCGFQDHLDTDFAYYIHCKTCGTIYACNGHIQMIELNKEEALYAKSLGASCKDVNDPEDEDIFSFLDQ